MIFLIINYGALYEVTLTKLQRVIIVLLNKQA